MLFRSRNWGDSQSWSSWKNIEALARGPAEESLKRFDQKPLMLQLSSVKKGDDQARWVAALPAFLESSLQMISMVIFDEESHETFKWSEASKIALSAGVKKAVFQANIDIIQQEKPHFPGAMTFDALDHITAISEGAHQWSGPEDFSVQLNMEKAAEKVVFTALIKDDVMINNHDGRTIEFGDSMVFTFKGTSPQKKEAEVVMGIATNAKGEAMG